MSLVRASPRWEELPCDLYLAVQSRLDLSDRCGEWRAEPSIEEALAPPVALTRALLLPPACSVTAQQNPSAHAPDALAVAL